MGSVIVRGEIISAPCTRCGDLACAVYQKASGNPCHHGPYMPPASGADVPTRDRAVRKIVPSGTVTKGN